MKAWRAGAAAHRAGERADRRRPSERVFAPFAVARSGLLAHRRRRGMPRGDGSRPQIGEWVVLRARVAAVGGGEVMKSGGAVRQEVAGDLTSK